MFFWCGISFPIGLSCFVKVALVSGNFQSLGAAYKNYGSIILQNNIISTRKILA